MNIFLDCGFYAGVALKIYMEKGVVDETWKIYAFECSPEINSQEVADSFPMPIELSDAAVWIKDGEVPFWISARNNASHVDETSSSARDHQITVPSIDFSKFVANLPDDAYIICSMDIEGSEFPVLEKMLQDGTAKKIRILDVEFHHRFMMPEYNAEVAQDIIDRLEEQGVLVTLKIPLE